MGLKMTLSLDKNHLYNEFVDAYWAITELVYDFDTLHFKLACFPSREARLLDGTKIEEPSIDGYGFCQPVYRPELYSWSPYFGIEEVFPEGIPLGRDAQLTQIYTFIKEYTGLPFEDVFEDMETAPEQTEEPVEPVTDPVAETPTEAIEEPTTEPEPEYDPLHL